MKQITLIILLLLTCVQAFNQQLTPIATKVGKLNISVDPRLELLSAVQVISDYSTINRNTNYSKELISFFSKDSAHIAAKITRQLFNDYGYAYDAPVDLMLRLSQVPNLELVSPYTDRMIERANGVDNLEKYRLALKQFATESNFEQFWNSKIPFYQKMVEYTANDLSDFDPVEKLENYYNESKNSYTATLSPSFIGGYGIRIPSSNNDLDIYGCINAPEMKEGIPYLSKLGLSYFLWHEFGHSFVNPLSVKYKTQIEASSNLFIPIEADMRAKANRDWDYCLNEHIIRALYIRMLALYENEDAARFQFETEKERRFVYIEPIIQKLKQFEHERETKNITFSEYYPTLLTVLDSLSQADNENLLNPPFMGPIRSVLGSSKTAIIYPTNDADTTALKSIFEYTSLILKMKSSNSIICSDIEALKLDLSDYTIMAYGSIESNLFLDKYKETFPFRVTKHTIITDRKHEGEKLRIITCLPNPFNPSKGMMINTATNNRYITGVRNAFTDDYIVFEDIETIVQQGIYKKDNNWHF